MVFSALPNVHQEELAKQSPVRHYSDRAIIQHRGETASGFYLIESGSVAVGRFLLSGDFRRVALLGRGDSWGELGMFAGRPRVVDAVSRGESQVRFITEAAFERVLSREPQLMRGILSALSAQLQEMLEIIGGIRRGSARPRIASMLTTLSDASGVVSITQQELGELLGLTRATVSTVLREFEESGALERGYGAITVRKRALLEEWAFTEV